jgi:vacuolar iron transporter family protein
MPRRLRKGHDAAVNRDEIRSITIDANDGIIATGGIVEGFSGAGAEPTTLLIAGVSAMIAGAISLAGAKYSETAAERDAQRAMIDEERRQLISKPDEELAELSAYYRAKGLTPELAGEVAAQLTARDALAAHVEAEHGITTAPSISPVKLAVLAGITFALGSGVPLLAVLLAPDALRTWVTLVAVVVSLCLTSVVVARSDKVSAARVLPRSVGIGVVTLVLTLAAGTLISL